MIEIERYNGKDEFSKLLKTMPIIPSNTEIVEKTGVSKGSVSEIMNGKRTPTKNFIDKFKKGFNLEQQETKNPPLESEGFFKEDNSRLISENEFLKQTVKDLLNILASKQ